MGSGSRQSKQVEEQNKIETKKGVSEIIGDQKVFQQVSGIGSKPANEGTGQTVEQVGGVEVLKSI